MFNSICFSSFGTVRHIKHKNHAVGDAHRSQRYFLVITMALKIREYIFISSFIFRFTLRLIIKIHHKIRNECSKDPFNITH